MCFAACLTAFFLNSPKETGAHVPPFPGFSSTTVHLLGWCPPVLGRYLF